MYIDKITYIATNQPAVQDDIFTLDITGMKDGVPVQNIMISGHSVLLSGGAYYFGADADTLVVIATDLDFDGHVIDVGGLQHRLPRTGSITRTYELDVSSIGVTEVTKPLIDPETGYVIAAIQAAEPVVATAIPVDQVADEMPTIQQAGIGLGALAAVGAGLYLLSKLKKR